MADVTYNPSSFPPLVRTISSLVAHTAARSKPPPLIVLAYKERDPDERSLWIIIKDELGVEFQQVGECIGAGGVPIEFWIGSVAVPPM
jgi:protein N-lysine methyltransferase METTL21D